MRFKPFLFLGNILLCLENSLISIIFKFSLDIIKKVLTYTYVYVIIIIESEVRYMQLIKKALIYLAHRQALKQDLIRKQHNREQINLIIKDL